MAGVRPFQLRKLGHVVLNVTDIEAAVRFYTEILGLQISDRYPDSMVPGGMVFMRYGTDHHGVALVGGAKPLPESSLNHFAFEVGTLAEVFDARRWLREQARWQQSGNLLEHRPGRHDRRGAPGERVAAGPHARGRHRQPGAWPAGATALVALTPQSGISFAF
jgi:catechol 2,3-dioxygenase-like lactoylglutathione lyase family enzyme